MMARITWEVKKSGTKIRYYANFRSYVTTEKEIEEERNEKVNNLDVRVGVPNPSEIIVLAKKLGCAVSRKKKWITVKDEYTYFRLIVYAVVRQILREPEKIERLERLVLDKDFDTDAWWWANTFINKYRNEGRKKGVGVRCLYRPAKAFKLVYGLADR